MRFEGVSGEEASSCCGEVIRDYYGRIDVDEKEESVTHRFQGSLRPYELGADLKRFFKLSGDRLDLSTPPPQLETGERRVYHVSWERVH